MSKIINFYLNQPAHPKGYTHEKCLALSNEQLEHSHDYIQWLFPVFERSQFNSSAPTLTQEDVNLFLNDDELHGKLWASFCRMLDFYGLFRSGRYDAIKGWPEYINGTKSNKYRLDKWVTPYDHNYLRLTRIMKCMNTLGFPKEAKDLQACLLEISDTFPKVVGEETRKYWTEAI